LHYVWVGGNLPDRVLQLIKHNRQYTSDYEIKLWTDDNLPELNKFAKDAAKKKNWAFVSDYVRFIALRQFGGIYLDTDQKLLKRLDDLHDLKFFAGWNRERTYIYTGIIGCVPRLDLVDDIIQGYETLEYDIKHSSPTILTKCYHNGERDYKFKVFNYTYFYPVSAGEKNEGKIFPHTYATHLWDESWVKFVSLRRCLRFFGFIKVYHAFLNKIDK